MQHNDVLFTQFSVFPTLVRVISALEQKLLVTSGPAMKSRTHTNDISCCYDSGVKNSSSIIV